MLCIRSPFRDPWFNLAAEEYLLKQFEEDIYFQYVDAPSVVVGKHQNTLAEINYRYLKENKILVARRLSGGGTVYHDHGNLNFSFLANGRVGALVDFKRFLKPVHEFLLSLGIAAQIGARNDLLIGEQKISGNAEHVYRQRTLHHGTLLFNSQLSSLGAALHCSGTYFDRAVQSKRSPVTNIVNHLDAPPGMQEFSDRLAQHISSSFGPAVEHRFSENDLMSIEQLRKSRYSSWDWIFAYSPDYRMEKTTRLPGMVVDIETSVRKGFIEKLSLQTDSSHQSLLNNLTACWSGVELREEVLVQKALQLQLGEKENQAVLDLVPELF